MNNFEILCQESSMYVCMCAYNFTMWTQFKAHLQVVCEDFCTIGPRNLLLLHCAITLF